MKIFRAFDALLYLNKPSNLGLKQIQSVYAGGLWPTSDRELLPPEQYAKNIFAMLAYDAPCFIDIEHWPLYAKDDLENREKINTITRWFKQVQSTQVGYYGLFPKRDYQRMIALLKWPEMWTSYFLHYIHSC